MKANTSVRVSLALAFVLAAPMSRAHECGPPQIEVQVNQCKVWPIKAVISESEESVYGLPSPPASGIATVSPAAPGLAGFPFASYTYGIYRICGVSPGTTSMTAQWSYAPNFANGPCPLTINTVVATTAAPNADNEYAGISGDPVDMYSGDHFQAFFPDLVLDGPMPIRYQRYYSSRLLAGGARDGFIGNGWLDNYTMALSGNATRLDVDFLWGRRLRFDKSGSNWVLNPAAGYGFQLRQSGSDYVLMDPSDQRRYTFDSLGRLRSIRDRNDNTLTLTYAAANQGLIPSTLSDGLGRTLTFTAVGQSQFSQVSDGTRSIFFSYVEPTESSIHQVSFTNAAGRITNYSYANVASTRPALLLSATRPLGNVPLSTTYDSQFRVATQTLASGQSFAFGWTAPSSTITTAASVRGFAHDATGRQTGYTDESGTTQQLSYTGGRRTGAVDFAGKARSQTIHAPTGYVASATDELGNTATYTWTPTTSADGFTYYDLTTLALPDGRSYTFAYDTRGNRTSITAPGGATTTTTYNARGQPLNETSALGGVTVNTYLANGMLGSTTDPAGNTTSYAYDALFRLTTITRPGGATRTFSWSALNQLTSTTDERGQVNSYAVDNNNRTTGETNVAGARTFGYDTTDRATAVTDRVGATITRTYDSRGRPMMDARSNGEQTRYAWDSRDNLTSLQLPSGATWGYGHDAQGRVVSSTDPTSATTGFVYDDAGRVTRINWPGGGNDVFQYDAMGRRTRATDAVGRVTQLGYDASGRLGTYTVGGSALAVTLNGPGQATRIVDPNTNQWNWTYDASGRLTTATDPLGGATTYTYDNRNRYASIAYPAALGSETLSYDARNHLTQRNYSDGTLIGYAYDTLGRITSGSNFTGAYDGEGRMTASNTVTVNRVAATGRITSLVYPSGPTITYGYDAGGRLVSISDGLGGITSIANDAVGRPTSFTFPNGSITTWTYDARGALVRIQHGAIVDLQLMRDLSGHVRSATRTQPTLYQPATATLTQSANAALGVTQVTSDALGRVTAADGVSYTWDGASRLATRTESASTAAYAWDLFYHLTGRNEGAGNETYRWNYALTQPGIATANINGVAAWHYVSLPDGRLLYRINAVTNARQYYVFDEMGNTVALLDAAGAVVSSYGYSPYGQRRTVGAAGNPFTYGGQNFSVTDAASERYFMGARLYDAQRTRFLSRDTSRPHVNPLAFNPFAFASGNPLYFIDPSGYDSTPPAPSPALDAASDGLNVLGAAGTAVDVTKELATKGLDKARAVTDALAGDLLRGPNSAAVARGPFNAAAAAQKAAQNTLAQATSKGMTAVSAIGNAASLVSGVIESYKLNNKLGEHESDWERSVRKARESSENASERAFEAYKAGNITFEQLRQRLLDIKFALDSALLAEQRLYDSSLIFDTADSTLNFFAGLVPGGDKIYSGFKYVNGVP